MIAMSIHVVCSHSYFTFTFTYGHVKDQCLPCSVCSQSTLLSY